MHMWHLSLCEELVEKSRKIVATFAGTATEMAEC